MSKSRDTIFLPREEKLTITADEFASGRIFSTDSSGQNTTYVGAVTPSSSTVLGPDNSNKYYIVELDKGTVTTLKEFAGTPEPEDDGLSDIAELETADGNIIVGDGDNWVAESGETARASLGVVIGTDVQAQDDGLQDIADLADPEADRLVFWDDSEGSHKYLTPGDGLTITDSTIDAPPAWEPLLTQTFTTESFVDFESMITGTHDTYMFVLESVTTSDSSQICMRLSNDNGSNYYEGATDYDSKVQSQKLTVSAEVRNEETGATEINLMLSSNAGTRGASGFVYAHNPLDAAQPGWFTWELLVPQNSARHSGHGRKRNDLAINAVRFFALFGTISGTIRMFGLAKS